MCILYAFDDNLWLMWSALGQSLAKWFMTKSTEFLFNYQPNKSKLNNHHSYLQKKKLLLTLAEFAHKFWYMRQLGEHTNWCANWGCAQFFFSTEGDPKLYTNWCKWGDLEGAHQLVYTAPWRSYLLDLPEGAPWSKIISCVSSAVYTNWCAPSASAPNWYASSAGAHVNIRALIRLAWMVIIYFWKY